MSPNTLKNCALVVFVGGLLAFAFAYSLSPTSGAATLVRALIFILPSLVGALLLSWMGEVLAEMRGIHAELMEANGKDPEVPQG